MLYQIKSPEEGLNIDHSKYIKKACGSIEIFKDYVNIKKIKYLKNIYFYCIF